MKSIILSLFIMFSIPDEKDKKKSKQKMEDNTPAGCVFLDGPSPEGISVNDTVPFKNYNFNFCGNEDIFKQIKVTTPNENN